VVRLRLFAGLSVDETAKAFDWMEGRIAMRKAVVAVGVLVACLVMSSGTLLAEQDCLSVPGFPWETLLDLPLWGCVTFSVDAPSRIHIDIYPDGGAVGFCSGYFWVYSATNSLVLYDSFDDATGPFFYMGGSATVTPGEYRIDISASCGPGPGFLFFFIDSDTLTDVDIVPPYINPHGRGVIPVALLGSEYLDVTEVDTTRLLFSTGYGYSACPRHDLADAWTYNEHLQDVNLDGYMDLMLHFHTQGAVYCGAKRGFLCGATLDSSTNFCGTDTFETVGCNSNRPSRGMTNRENEGPRMDQSQLNTEERQHLGDLVEQQRVD
jgi:hypothetical protein